MDRSFEQKLNFPSLGCGTWAWGNRLLWGYKPEMDRELQGVFDFCVNQGITFFDTGDSYGTGKLQGKSESLLGQFAQQYQGLNQGDICLATKLAPYPWRLTPQAIVKAGQASSQRLGRPLDLVQLHWSTANYAPWQENNLLIGLAQLVEQGLAKAVGLSNFGPKRLQNAYQLLGDRGIKIASLQVQYSLLSSYPVSELDLKSLCDQLGIKLIAYSPLTLGLLTGKYTVKGPFPKGVRGFLFRQLLPKIQPVLTTVQAIAESRQKTMAQVALNWCMAKGTMPIPGAKNLKQAEENFGAIGWHLDAGEIAELDRATTQLEKKMVQNIFQSR
ncbi:MAG: aldo/keto reductase [Microcystaceae cyanobacterium]